MKTLITLFFLSVGLSYGQTTIAGQTSWGDSLRWGGSVDSSSSILARGTAVLRDSLGTWVTMPAGNCSKPSRIERGAQQPIWKYEIQYEVRTSAGNTDSSQVLLKFDTRYCKDAVRSIGCGSWIAQGRHDGYAGVSVRDSMSTIATTSGVTWMPTQQLFFPGGGSQLRACVSGIRAGGAATDSTFLRGLIVRYQ